MERLFREAIYLALNHYGLRYNERNFAGRHEPDLFDYLNYKFNVNAEIERFSRGYEFRFIDCRTGQRLRLTEQEVMRYSSRNGCYCDECCRGGYEIQQRMYRAIYEPHVVTSRSVYPDKLVISKVADFSDALLYALQDIDPVTTHKQFMKEQGLKAPEYDDLSKNVVKKQVTEMREDKKAHELTIENLEAVLKPKLKKKELTEVVEYFSKFKKG